jgi:hypothetical protein
MGGRENTLQELTQVFQKMTCYQELPRRKASVSHEDLSECARKGIAGEPPHRLLMVL